MVVRVGGIVLACLIGLPIGQAAAQGDYPYQPRVVGPYAAYPAPGYYVPRRYYRLPPGYYDDDVVAIGPRGRRVYLYDGYPVRPYARRYVRVVPGPYRDDDAPLPRPHFRGPDTGPIVPDEREVAPDDRRWRDRQAAPPSLEPDPRALPQIEPRAPVRQSALPPVPDNTVQPQSASDVPRRLHRQIVEYPTREPAGTVVIDTRNTYLYYVRGDGTAVRYGIGVGREGFTWSGREKVSRKAEWPDWYPPKDMIERQPFLPRMMAGGPGNPLGARALYLGNTLYRIHGTNEPSTIGRFVSSGCIRLLNADIEDLYSRVQVGTRVVVLPGGKRPPASASARR